MAPEDEQGSTQHLSVVSENEAENASKCEFSAEAADFEIVRCVGSVLDRQLCDSLHSRTLR